MFKFRYVVSFCLGLKSLKSWTRIYVILNTFFHSTSFFYFFILKNLLRLTKLIKLMCISKNPILIYTANDSLFIYKIKIAFFFLLFNNFVKFPWWSTYFKSFSKFPYIFCLSLLLIWCLKKRKISTYWVSFESTFFFITF